MSAAVASPAGADPVARARGHALADWWPLAALLILAAALRLSTLGLQSLWYDEAFTPVHVFHPGLGATLHSVVHTENTPPLWYVLLWAWTRVLGTGAVALRLPSALFGVASVGVAWAIGRELTARRATAIAAAAFVAVNPLFVWYSQEARAYALFVLMAALAMLCFLRARDIPTPGRLAAFAATASLALLSEYFAVFLIAPMIVMLLLRGRLPGLWEERPERGRERAERGRERAERGRERAERGRERAERGRERAERGRERAERGRERAGDDGGRASCATLAKTGTDRRSASAGGACLPALVACAVPIVVGLALLPLVAAQGGHGAQWIGEWALASRLQAIPQYYLTGYSGAPLGHGIELLVALPILAGLGWGLWNVLDRREERGALIALSIAASGVLLPILLIAFGADYLAPRNLVAAMIPVSVLIAVVVTARRAGRAGSVLAALIAVAGLAITVAVDLSPRLQRGDWRGVAKVLRAGAGADKSVITTVELGAAPLEYYLPPLHNLAEGTTVTVSEIDETGYAPLRASADAPPAPGFHLQSHADVHGLIVYRFVSPTPRAVSEATLRRHVITEAHPEVLVAPGVQVSLGA